MLTFYIHLNKKRTSLVVTARYCCRIIWISPTSLKLHSYFFRGGGWGGGGGERGEGLIYEKCVERSFLSLFGD